MSESTQQSADDLAERVRDLFANAREVLTTDQSTADGAELADELADSERTAVRDLADDAAELLETSEPGALLAALGLEGSDGPGSIPAAILTGDPDDVADLRALLALSRLVPDEDGDGAFDESEREAIATLADLFGEESADEPEAADGEAADADGEAEAADSEAEDADGETETADGDTGDDAADTETAAGEAESADEGDSDEITSALEDALADVQAGLGDAFGIDAASDEAEEGGEDDGLVEAAGDFVDDTGERLVDAATGESEADTDGSEEADASDEEAETEDDDGLLGLGDEGGLLDGDESGLGGGDSKRDRASVSSFGRTKHSTIPAQDRPDMSGVRRYSTMPER